MNTEENDVLGFRANGTPIRKAKPGFLTTAAFIMCSHCNKAISSSGGPSYGAICISCAGCNHSQEPEEESFE
ncbi:hypothetical protein RIVERRIDER_28 [Xanthomonas phage RiverRider]|uniref:Uncharacterized protein n=1 Tax=Xanthomonas phage RiverRider TaxID=2108116 RepID=A0A2P1JUT8_9CAUD|nr:hypothetical protein HWB58_gp28 [Xanthomonas phage RiverRider]AVO23116.1 hypothetical protein RIVERRIDER_28 [Xanthomonas phage RiverRider]